MYPQDNSISIVVNSIVVNSFVSEVHGRFHSLTNIRVIKAEQVVPG